MEYTNKLNNEDKNLVASQLKDFVPKEVFDIHAHPYKSAHFGEGVFSFLNGISTLGINEHHNALQRYMPVENIHGLYFGMPHQLADRKAVNRWVANEVKSNGTSLSRSLRLTSPEDDPTQVADELRGGDFCGMKVYHCYANRFDTMNASITEYAPEWMWEILHETQGVMMLHIVKNSAIADEDNQREIRRLCQAYPKAKIILAHVARSFNYRNGRAGMHVLADLDNVVVDTSAVGESEAFRAALDILGPKRILWGSDFAVSELRGRCVTTGSRFFWLHPEHIQATESATETALTLVGIESLIALREACMDLGLSQNDIRDIFLNNALRFLKSHLPADAYEPNEKGPEQWEKARKIISGGTGLLSKRAEMFDVNAWPSYFTRCSGCEVLDMNGYRYIDFAGGIGAVLLGYSDTDVNAAVRRRVSFGNYCTLVNPQEISLAEKLLELHPWAQKVRYGRTGGETMAMAVRIARASTGKSGVAFCGYHGWHDWYLAANLGKRHALDGHLLPGLEPRGVPRELAGTSVPFYYNDLNSLDEALEQINGNVAAVVMEPMRSQFPKDQFIKKVAAKCHAEGAVFIVDEITSGLRYGYPGALSSMDIHPDIVVYAKAMSNGFPFGTVIGKDEVMNAGETSFISSSYWTDGIGTAAALKTLKKVERLNVTDKVWKKGEIFQAALQDMADNYPSCQVKIGGMPSTPTLTFELEENSLTAKTLYIRKMLKHGFLVSNIFYLMHAHKEKHLNRLLESLAKVLGEIEHIITNGELEKEYNNQNQSGFARLT